MKSRGSTTVVGLRLPRHSVISAWLIYPSPCILLLHSIPHHHHRSETLTSPSNIIIEKTIIINVIFINVIVHNQIVISCLARIFKLPWTLLLHHGMLSCKLYSHQLTGGSRICPAFITFNHWNLLPLAPLLAPLRALCVMMRRF